MKQKRLLTLLGCIGVVLVLIALCFAAACAKPAPPEAKTLKVGAVFAVTGPAAPTIKYNIEGAILAAEWINEKGGITVNGQQYLIEIVAEDNKSSPDGAVAAANKLVYQDKVQFIIGPVTPQCAAAMTPITEENKVLRCRVDGIGHPSEMNPDLRYTFTTYLNMNHVVPAYDYFVESYPQAKTVAMTGPDDPGGQAAVAAAEKEAKSRGFEVVFAELYPFGTEDFYPILTKALDQKPDAIDITVGVTPWFAGIIKQARELGFTGPMFSACPTGDIYLLRDLVGRDFADEIFLIEPDLMSPEMPPILREIGKRVSEKYGMEVTYAHIGAWEALWCMVQAIEEAQSLDTTVIAETWEKMESIDTLFGKARMGGLETWGINHVVMRPAPISRMVKGEVEFIKFVTP